MGIRYDIDIDLKIINTIFNSEKKEASHTDLRYNAVSSVYVLDQHLECLERWGLISNQNPIKNGKARRVTLRQPYEVAICKLNIIKNALETVNEYFP